MALTSKVAQDLNKSFEYAHRGFKIFGFSPDKLRNSTTVSTLLYIHLSK